MAALHDLEPERLIVARRVAAHPNPDHDVLRHERAVCCSRREDDWEAGLDALYEREALLHPRADDKQRGWTRDA